MTKRLFILLAFLGVLGIGLFWFDRLIEKRADDAYTAGKMQCVAEFAEKIMQNNLETTAKTQEIIKYKGLLKEQRKELNDDCKAIYNIDLSICRNQLRNKSGS